MKPTTKKNRPKPFDEMSTTGALSQSSDVTRPKPFDEMSTTGALSQSSDVTRSLRPIARPARKPVLPDQQDRQDVRAQELIDYVEGLQRQQGAEAYVAPRPMDPTRTPVGKPRTMGERMRDAETRQQRPAKKFKDGGKVNGFPDLNKDGKITKADILKGRGVEGFADGGMVRGVKPGQMSGTKFSGTF